MTPQGLALFMLRWRWEARRVGGLVIRAYSGWTVASVVIAVFAVFAFAWSRALAVEAADLRSAAAEQRRGLSRPDAERQGDVKSIAVLQAILPPSDRAPQIVQQLIVLAEHEKLLLPAGEYKFASSTAAATQTYRIRLPISGNAAAIQRFVLGAINEHRALGVEALRMHRERVESAEAEANVQFVLITSPLGTGPLAGGAP